MARDVDRMLSEHVEWNDVQRSLVGRCKDHVSGGAIAVGPQPVRRRDAPAVTRDEPGEVVMRSRGGQVVADPALVLEERGGHDRAHRVAAQVLWPGVTAPVAVEPGDGVVATRLQFAAKHVAIGHLISIATGGRAGQVDMAS